MLTVGRVGAGTGCQYLTGQVASGKDDFATLSPAEALSYFSDTHAHGESPGRWLGRGLDALNLGGVVAAGELENLVGYGRHPHYEQLLHLEARRILGADLTGAQRRKAMVAAEKKLYLGRGFATYESALARAERAVADLGEDADEASRDAVRAQVLAEGDRQAVAGYELTFTPVKSVSVLAAAGGDATWAAVMEAHRAAVGIALEYVQDHASFSRARTNGERQVDTHGLIIAAFEHRMSREQDPNIHTHAIVANRVLCTDGKWRTVDGRAIYAASVGARAVYEQALESELAHRLGVVFTTEERSTIREVGGIPLTAIQHFSKRRAAIEGAMNGAVEGAVNPGVWRRLARRWTLSTREAKTGAESTAAALRRWQAEMKQSGINPQALIQRATGHQIQDSRKSDADVLAEALAILVQTRAVWTRHHAILAISRALPPALDSDFAAHQTRVESLAHRLLAGGMVQQVTPPDLLTVGPTLRRDSDGESVFNPHAGVLYAARSTTTQEQRILAALHDTTAPALGAAQVDARLAEFALGADQAEAARRVLTDPARICAIVGPAGAGKTHLQRVIAAAWGTGGQVLALAPSQISAAVLADSIGCRAENTSKWLYENRRAVKHRVTGGDWVVQPGRLVILDEAGMCSTRDLEAVAAAVRRGGGKLLLVGDDKQLPAVGSGGMFATIAERTDAPALRTVRRFRDPDGTIREWECAASLGLRDRSVEALADYERHGRLHAGPAQRMEQAAYRAWLHDHLTFEGSANRDVALLMADTEAGAAALSARARADLVARGIVEAIGTPLEDGTVAGEGDLVVTRLNERRIRAETGDGFVANRDTWRVTKRHPDGAVTVEAVTGPTRTLTLPASYVAANVQLGYAGTVHSAQGRTVTTARGLVTDATTAEALYVMLTRGRLSNHAYVVTDSERDEEHQLTPPQHAMSILAAILERDPGLTGSVTDVERHLYDQAGSLRRLRVLFADLAADVQSAAYADVITETGGAELATRVTADPSWTTLVQALLNGHTNGWDAAEVLRQAITQRELSTAADAAAVLHWRCQTITREWNPVAEDPAEQPTWTQQAQQLTAASRETPAGVDAAAALQQVAHLMDQRTRSLALLAADAHNQPNPPSWVAALGELPEDGPRRQQWLRHAAAIAGYLDATGHQPDPADPIGPRPPTGDVQAQKLWSFARQAVREAANAGTLRAATDELLRSHVEAGVQAETQQQPAYIGHHLRRTSLRARAQRSRVNLLTRQAAAADTELATARRRWLRDSLTENQLHRTAEQLTAQLGRAQATLASIETELSELTAMHDTWQQWADATADLRLTARLAAQELALRDIPVPVEPTSNGADPEQYAICAAAADWFTTQLPLRWAPSYLAARKLDTAAAAAGAGYAPSGPGEWTSLLDHLRKLGFSDDAVEACGLAVPSRCGQLIDRFRDRLILPVLDQQGRPIGFLGRKSPADTSPDNPKYLNCPGTPLYSKGRALYGLDSQAVQQLRRGLPVVVVEGPMDVLAVRQATDELVPVAPCGTAMTMEHVQLLAAHTALSTVLLCLDPDDAGRAASLRTGHLLIEAGAQLESITLVGLPDGADPATVLAEGGAELLRRLLLSPQQHYPHLDLAIDARIERWWTDGQPVAQLPIHTAVARHAIGGLLQLQDSSAITRQVVRIADRTGLDATEVSNMLLDRLVPPEDDSERRRHVADFQSAPVSADHLIG